MPLDEVPTHARAGTDRTFDIDGQAGAIDGVRVAMSNISEKVGAIGDFEGGAVGLGLGYRGDSCEWSF